jgi:hypothetical protein
MPNPAALSAEVNEHPARNEELPNFQNLHLVTSDNPAAIELRIEGLHSLDHNMFHCSGTYVKEHAKLRSLFTSDISAALGGLQPKPGLICQSKCF